MQRPFSSSMPRTSGGVQAPVLEIRNRFFVSTTVDLRRGHCRSAPGQPFAATPWPACAKNIFSLRRSRRSAGILNGSLAITMSRPSVENIPCPKIPPEVHVLDRPNETASQGA